MVIVWWYTYDRFPKTGVLQMHPRYFNVIGQILPNQACEPIVHGMAGGDAGDFQVQGGDRSWSNMGNIVLLNNAWVAGHGERQYALVSTILCRWLPQADF